MTELAVIHPTRGRPAKAWGAFLLWRDRAVQPKRASYIFVVERDDQETRDYLAKKLASEPLHFDATVLTLCDEGTPVAAFNKGARVAVDAGATLLLCAADDVVPPPRWDEEVTRRLEHHVKLGLPAVLAPSDGHRRDRLIPHPIMTRWRFEQVGGWIFYPGYRSIYADVDFTACAYVDKVVVEARDLVFEHQHPDHGFGAKDEGYLRTNAGTEVRQGEGVFYKRFPNGFQLVLMVTGIVSVEGLLA